MHYIGSVYKVDPNQMTKQSYARKYRNMIISVQDSYQPYLELNLKIQHLTQSLMLKFN